MVTLIEELEDNRLSYFDALKAIVRYGHKHHNTTELLNVSVRDDLLGAVARPGISLAIGAVEGLGLVAGIQPLSLLAKVQPRFLQYANGGALEGAYGPRIRRQLRSGVGRIAKDNASRQFTVSIWQPEDSHESVIHSLDVPCTVAMSFMIRDKALAMTVYMRSSDAWMGLPYDLMQFRILHNQLARALHATRGEFTLHAMSMHVYDRDLDRAEDWLARGGASKVPEWLIGPLVDFEPKRGNEQFAWEAMVRNCHSYFVNLDTGTPVNNLIYCKRLDALTDVVVKK